MYYPRRTVANLGRIVLLLFLSVMTLPAAPDTDYKIDADLLKKLTEEADTTAPMGERPEFGSGEPSNCGQVEYDWAETHRCTLKRAAR